MRGGRVLLPLAGALVAWALFFGNGQSSDRLLWIGGAALVVASLVGAATFWGLLPRPRVGALGLAFVACFAGLVLWQGFSILWSVQPDRSWDYVNRGVAYLAFLVIGLFLGALASRRAAVNGLALLLALVLAYAFLAKGIPALYPDYERLARLRSPIGYWNALALLGDIALVLGLWRAAQRRRDAALLVFAGTLAVLLAYSRGGVVIGVIAVGLWLALDRRRFESLSALALGGAGGVAVAGISLALHGVSDDHESHSARVHDGRLFLLAVVVAGALVAALSWRAARLELDPQRRRRATRALFAAIAVAGIAGVVGVSLHKGPSSNVGAAGEHCVQGASRFACASSDARIDWWKQSWDLFTDRPLLGSGAGSFGLAHRLRQTKGVLPADEPHNLALQALGETGIVGFALFVGAVTFAVLALRRRVREDDAALALGICALAYLLHALIDIDYDFVAVSAPFFLLLGMLLARRGPVVERRDPVWALGTVLLGAAAILALAAPYVAERKVEAALRSTSLARALDLAHQAHTWNPVSIEPLEVQASLEPNELRALQLYREAVDTQPDNPEAWVQLGLFELRTLKDACSAYRDLNQAYTLDRFNADVATKGGALDEARARVNAGACGTG